jgi:protein required for attachment to host cells
MMHARLNRDCWVLVADGSRALVLRNIGDAMSPNLKTVRAYEQTNPPTREQGADKPPRVHDAFGTHRSTIEQTDWHRIAEDRFMQRIADDLEKDRQTGAFEKLIVAAPPVALGQLRKAMNAHLKQAVSAEFDKDWTPMPVAEIEKAVTRALAA